MLVKYIGKASMLISEYDGKRYVFSKLRPVTDIPIKVYNYIQASRGIYAGDVIPFIPPPNVVPPEENVKENTPIVRVKNRGKKK
jgi:hypothetical protein